MSDRFTFVRYLMPEAQSVLLCNAADFKSIMDFLFFAISVCTDRRLNDFLTKAFFDLRKNYGFTWKLNIGHVLAVLLNYGGNEKAILQDVFYNRSLKEHRKAAKETGQSIHADTYGVRKKLPKFFQARMDAANETNKSARVQVPEEQFSFCVSRFILLLSEFSAGLTSHLDMIVKQDFSDHCVFLFLILLTGTDRRFVTSYRVIESITSLLHYNFDMVPAGLWYRGPVLKDKQQAMRHGMRNFIRTLAKMVHEFQPGEFSTEMMTWRPDGRRDDERADHPLNMLHKLELIPASFRGNQLKKQLAFLFFQSRLQTPCLIEPEMASILNVANEISLRNCARGTYLKLITHKSSIDYRALLIILKLLDIIVGFEPELDYSEEKVEAISIMNKELLEVLKKKLPSIGMSTARIKLSISSPLGD
jgi:hypothetical protein